MSFECKHGQIHANEGDCPLCKEEGVGGIDQRYEGLFPPGYCPRQRTDCSALSQIIATDHASFLCCGQNDGTTRTVDQDQYRVCIKSSENNDLIQDCDKRDLTHQAAVIMGALASIEQADSVAYHVTVCRVCGDKLGHDDDSTDQCRFCASGYKPDAAATVDADSN